MMRKESYIKSIEKCLEWINSRMLTFNGGYNGIYERIRIDLNNRTNWSRPDCNAELARVIYLYNKITGDEKYNNLFNNIIEWLKRVQDNDPLSIWKGSFPFYLIDGYINDPPIGDTVYQNDNGKILIVLTQLYSYTNNSVYIDMAKGLADYWVSLQQEDGTFARIDSKTFISKDAKTLCYPKGPCFVLWLAAGLLLAYKATGDDRYLNSAIKALRYIEQYQLENGRFRTSYELMEAEDWRPVSSETSIALFAFSIAYKITGDERYLYILKKAGDFVLSLQHSCVGILNCDDSCLEASLQNNKSLCDLVYTQGFALMGLIEAFKATGDEAYLESAKKLADFLVEIQCNNESPLWDGAWRGSFNVETWKWDGRANQNNPIDEGGMYSVYTGWCATTIMYGLLMLLEMEKQ